MSTKNQYLSTSQQTLIKVVITLSKKPLNPKPLTELVTEDINRDQLFRTLKNLEAAGWDEQLSNGWRLTSTITTISEYLHLQIADMHRRYLDAKEGTK